MARREAARCRSEYAWLAEITQRLHTLETEGWDSLDFESTMAAGGDRIGAVAWERTRCLESIEYGILELAPCPDPKSLMGNDLFIVFTGAGDDEGGRIECCLTTQPDRGVDRAARRRGPPCA